MRATHIWRIPFSRIFGSHDPILVLMVAVALLINFILLLKLFELQEEKRHARRRTKSEKYKYDRRLTIVPSNASANDQTVVLAPMLSSDITGEVVGYRYVKNSSEK